MKYIKKIEIGFENCLLATVDVSNIGGIILEDIGTKIVRIGTNAVASIDQAKTLALEILAPEAQRIFDVLKDSSITSITTIDEFGDETEYQVFYEVFPNEESDLGARNIHEKFSMSSLGNLYIVVSEDKELGFFFDEESINDEEYMTLVKDSIS